MKVININSLSAFKLLSGNKNFYMIDVRTEQEWQKGVPMIDNLMLLSWKLYPDMSINKEFCEHILEFKNSNDSFKQDLALFFLCKSGARSFEAANIIAEYDIGNCYNIMDGFEGNAWGMGWKANNLPYIVDSLEILQLKSYEYIAKSVDFHTMSEERMPMSIRKETSEDVRKVKSYDYNKLHEVL